MSVNLPTNFDVEGIVSSSRCPECQEICQESVVGAQRGSWTSEGASWVLRDLPGERLKPKWPAGRVSWAPRDLPGGRLGPQKPVNRGSKGEKWPILVTVSVSRGPPRESCAPKSPKSPKSHKRPTEICL